MADIFLTNNETFTIFSGTLNRAFGSSQSGIETIRLLGSPAGVQLDANI